MCTGIVKLLLPCFKWWCRIIGIFMSRFEVFQQLTALIDSAEDHVVCHRVSALWMHQRSAEEYLVISLDSYPSDLVSGCQIHTDVFDGIDG
ncbi:toxin-antitoxin system, toxin component, RelE domain protein [Opisthorchis viverrini]|uniref:Toxin-antitoxin system, toxin component, RelE domain protein n=1 Tax=Opisthorchis viverrini TaxID=6198 RepID=A0A1S8WPX7_OPIVI|nr:toxin-antitoxin system, toxin component, RelE domain protein [Opisthorchis viverrini]